MLSIPAFPFFGRVKELPIRIREQCLQSRAMGIRDSKDVTTDGRLQFDMLTYFVREHKLRSYSLNSVSAQFLGEQKEEVMASQIEDLQNGD